MGDKYSCDYKSADVEDDPRLKHCSKSGYIIFLSYIAVDLLVLIVSYALCPPIGEAQRYILGYPLWYGVDMIICFSWAVVGLIWGFKNKKFSLAAKAGYEEVDE